MSGPLNPPDIPTRESSSQAVLQSGSVWLSGPSFLYVDLKDTPLSRKLLNRGTTAPVFLLDKVQGRLPQRDCEDHIFSLSVFDPVGSDELAAQTHSPNTRTHFCDALHSYVVYVVLTCYQLDLHLCKVFNPGGTSNVACNTRALKFMSESKVSQGDYRLARITQVHPDTHGVVKSVTVKMQPCDAREWVQEFSECVSSFLSRNKI